MHKLIPVFLLLILNVEQARTQTTNIAGPVGSGAFGTKVYVLTNGNYVVIDPLYDYGAVVDVGAVYLYNGSTHELISMLRGSTANDKVGWSPMNNDGRITPLDNGNFIVQSPVWDNGPIVDAGAITLVNGVTGLSGVINNTNSLVGSSANDQLGYTEIKLLPNGNFVVPSQYWDNGAAADAGAVTWCNGATGITGTISAANSLIGSTANDAVGGSGITILYNGNYVVTSRYWDNGIATDAGAVTWCNGATGTTGTISVANSLIGSTANDEIGESGITILNNGNYVVISQNWDNGAAVDAGAVTWCNGSSGTSGIVNSSNSLVGSHTNDWVGSYVGGVSALTNGNYVVMSSSWDNGSIADAGAVTWCNGSTGTSGIVSSNNSLVGSQAGDKVGGGGGSLSHVITLSNGNYVVNSPTWDIGPGLGTDNGAVTWADGTTGITGVITASNSLVGVSNFDRIGSAGITPLTNGNYVVSSPEWHGGNGAITHTGAVTWGNGATGITGTVSISNSLVGSTSNDLVGGYGGTIGLKNGNYVVVDPFWDNGLLSDVGAVTWGNGMTGITGVININNSLIGSHTNDLIGYVGGVGLANGNYVIGSPLWDNGTVTDAGAVTWGNGNTGLVGYVNDGNSLVGSSSHDQVGLNNIQFGITELSNSNYVISSPSWQRNASVWGAVTWCNGVTGTTGAISSNNSLVSSTTHDDVGYWWSVTALSNGNYVVKSWEWNNGTAAQAGAVTWGNGATGISGDININNSLIGTNTGDFGALDIIDFHNGKYVVRNPYWDYGQVADTGAVTLCNSAGGTVGIITSCNSVFGRNPALVYNNNFDYLVIGLPDLNRVSIYRPTALAIASTLDSISVNVAGNMAIPIIANGGCRIIATLTPNGTNPVHGTINAKTWIESTVLTQNGNPFVARHYQITPVTDVSSATGKLTLYFAQQEFDNFNDHPASTYNLPTAGGDAAGKANLRIYKYPGISSDGSGLPGSYSASPQMIDPIDTDIVWNSMLNRWEVSFNVTGFSGFIVQTSLPALPLTLLEFKGSVTNNNGVLNWKTTDEMNTMSFDIERSINGSDYTTIGNTPAANRPGIHQYTYTDSNINLLAVPVVYYRLKQKDIDGRFTYSRIIGLPINNSEPFVIFYPDPVSNVANLVITVQHAQKLHGKIMDNTGRLLQLQQWDLTAGSNSFTINVNNLAKGMYYLELEGGITHKIIPFKKL